MKDKPQKPGSTEPSSPGGEEGDGQGNHGDEVGISFGRRVRVSIAAFADFGTGRRPHDMIGSRAKPTVHGEIGVREDADTQVMDGPRAHHGLVELVFLWRRWLAVLVPAIMAIAGGSWAWLQPPPPVGETPEIEYPSAAVEPCLVQIPARDVVEEAGAEELEDGDDGDDGEDDGAEPPVVAAVPVHERAECRERRARADRARQSGDWNQLERLARQQSCWPRKTSALALQMRALFELDRYAECVALGSSSKSKEVKRWLNNCKRALQ